VLGLVFLTFLHASDINRATNPLDSAASTVPSKGAAASDYLHAPTTDPSLPSLKPRAPERLLLLLSGTLQGAEWLVGVGDDCSNAKVCLTPSPLVTRHVQPDACRGLGLRR
jgi:hypothetical protein